LLLKGQTSSYKLPRFVKVTLEVDKSSNEAGKVSKVQLNLAGDEVAIVYGNGIVKRIEINGEKYEPGADQYWFANLESKIPTFVFLARKDGESGEFYIENSSWVTARVVSHLRLVAHGNTSTETLRLVAKQLSYAPSEEFSRQFARLTTAPESLKIELAARDVEGRYLSRLRSALLLHSLSEIVREVGEAFEGLAKGVRYIEPIRASVERYYRLQDLAVDEIDSSGGNTAMYLHSLDEDERSSLKEWMQSNLGFHVYTEMSGGNVEIKIVVKEGAEGRNVTDLGFGYSQILPVVIQLWHSCIRPAGRNTSPATVIAIEQPELHLHPRYQALLSDVFAGVSLALDAKTHRVPIFVETHSEHIVNRLGALVSGGVISHDDVQVLLFENDGESSRIRRVEFDEQGVLQDSWPLGFFIPEA